MRWKLSDSKERKRLERAFSSRNIPFNAPGFCDHPRFLNAEREDPCFLELYARYVEARSYDEGYLVQSATKVQAAAQSVENAVRTDGRLGACVDACGILGRMLDRLGVWNYVAKATLTIAFPSSSGLTPRYFWAFDQGDFVAPHAIVVAPPFGVIDVTVRYQGYDADQSVHLPNAVIADDWSPATWAPEDLANPGILGGLTMRKTAFSSFLRARHPQMFKAMQTLPAREILVGGTRLKYVIVAVGGFIEPLEEITGYKPCGRTALQIFEEEVAPQFASST